jgi:hypothetical protein
MTDYAPPSRNPADSDSLTGLLKLALSKFQQNADDMLPATVIAYDPASNRAQVQPVIQVVTTANQLLPRAQIASVPVYQASGGGFLLRFPVSSGDLGWIKANDRDISLYKQTYATSPPNTQRRHSFEDGVFIPQAAWSLIAIASEDTANAVFQNYAGSVKIALWTDLIKILAPNGVGINATPRAGTILDLHSTNQALGLPAMTTSQKNAIPSPQKGFMVFDTTLNSTSVFNGSTWS